MTALADFRSRIAPRVMTALDPAIDQAVLDTCIDFCEQTLIVQMTLDPIVSMPGVAEYELEPSDCDELAVCKIMRAWADDREMSALAEDYVVRATSFAPVPNLTPTLGFPTAFHETSPGVVRVMFVPDSAYQQTYRVAVRPTRNASEVPDVLYENWVDAIVDGALVRLFSVPGVSYSNPKLAAAHAGSYRIGVNRALLESSRGRTRPVLFVPPVHM